MTASRSVRLSAHLVVGLLGTAASALVVLLPMNNPLGVGVAAVCGLVGITLLDGLVMSRVVRWSRDGVMGRVVAGLLVGGLIGN